MFPPPPARSQYSVLISPRVRVNPRVRVTVRVRVRARVAVRACSPPVALLQIKITSQRLLDQSQAGVYRGKRHIPPHLGLFAYPTPRG